MRAGWLALLACLLLVPLAYAIPPVDPILPGTDHTGEDHSGHDHSDEDLSVTSPGTPTNMSETQLVGSDLSRSSWGRAIFEDADLADAICTDADFISIWGLDARFDGADLSGADFSDADLSYAILDDASAICSGTRCASFDGANLRFSHATDADFSGASFVPTSTPTNLHSATLDRSNFSDASFDHTIMRYSSMRGGTFDGATFCDVDMSSISSACTPDIHSTDPNPPELCASYVGADFNPAGACPNSDLSFADLREANLQKANFVGVNLRSAQLWNVDASCLADDQDADCTRFAGADLRNTQLIGVNFDHVRFTDSQSQNPAKLTHSIALCFGGSGGDCPSFMGVSFAGVNLRDAQFAGSSFCDFLTTDEDLYDCASFDDALLGAGPNDPDDGIDLFGVGFQDIDFSRMPDDAFQGVEGGNLTFIDFSGSNLVDKEFANLDLSGSVLSGTNLSGVDITGAKLDDVNIDSDAGFPAVLCEDVDGVVTCLDFTSAASITGLKMRSTLLDGISFADTILGSADFSGSDLTNVSFVNVDLRDVTLDGILAQETCTTDDPPVCIFDGAMLAGVSMRDALLADANEDLFQTIDGADLSEADLSGSDLTGLNFSGLTLDGILLIDTVLDGANFDAASFSDAGTKIADLSGAFAFPIDDPDSTDPDDLIRPSFVDADLTGVRFRGAIFESADLTRTILEDVDMACDAEGIICTELTESTLQRTNFSGADLTGAVLNRADLSDPCDTASEPCIDFTGTILNSLAMTDTDFANVRPEFFFDAATAMGSTRQDLQSTDFARSLVSNLDFSNYDLSNANLTGVELCAIPDGEVDYSCLTVDDTLLEGVNFTAVDFSEAKSDYFQKIAKTGGSLDLRNTVFASVTVNSAAPLDMRGVDLTGARLDPSIFCPDCALFGSDTILTDATISNVSFSTEYPVDYFQTLGAIDGVHFEGSDLSGMNLDGLNLEDVDFTSVNASGVSLNGAVMTGALLANASWAGVAFEDVAGADLTGIATSANDEPRMDNTDLTRTSFTGMDLRGFIFAGAILSGTNLQGTRLFAARLEDLDLSAPCNGTDPDIECIDFSGADFVSVMPGDGPYCDVGAEVGDLDCIGTSFVNSNFNGLDPETFQSILGRDLSYGIFFGSEFHGMNFRDFTFNSIRNLNTRDVFCNETGSTAVSRDCADLTGADFTDADLRLIDLTTAKVAGAIFEEANLNSARFDSISDWCYDDDDNPGTPDLCIEFDEANLTAISIRDSDMSQLAVLDPGIFKRAEEIEVATGEMMPNMFGANLSDSDFSEMDLSGIELSESTLINTDLTNANLSGAHLITVAAACAGGSSTGFFDCAVFTDADLSFADARNSEFFDGVTITRTNFTGADLRGSQFNGQNFSCGQSGADCVNLTGADISFTFMRDIDFTNAEIDFTNRNLKFVAFQDSNFSGLVLSLSDFEGATLDHANFSSASLTNASFDAADFASDATSPIDAYDYCTLPPGTSKVDLRGADLRGAKFANAIHFHDGCIEVDGSTIYNSNTTFPVGFSLKGVMLPEPDAWLLQLAGVISLALIASRRRQQPGSRA